jgi:hypothetical protein
MSIGTNQVVRLGNEFNGLWIAPEAWLVGSFARKWLGKGSTVFLREGSTVSEEVVLKSPDRHALQGLRGCAN